MITIFDSKSIKKPIPYSQLSVGMLYDYHYPASKLIVTGIIVKSVDGSKTFFVEFAIDGFPCVWHYDFQSFNTSNEIYGQFYLSEKSVKIENDF